MNFEKWEIPVFVHMEFQSTTIDLGEKIAVLDLLGHVQPVSSCGGDILWEKVTGDGSDGGMILLPPTPNFSKNQHF